MPTNTSHHPDPFTHQAHQWWDASGPFWTLHQLNPLRLQFILDHLSPGRKTSLDIGCGGGLLSEALFDKGAEIEGVDASEEAIFTAKLHAKKRKIKIDYTCQEADHFLENNTKQYDMITCLELLEHVDDPSRLLQLCSSRLKPNGWFFASTLNRTLKSFSLAIVAAEHVLKWIPKGTHQYEQFIKPSEMISWARQCNLIPRSLSGIELNPFTKKFTLNQDPSVNYIMAFQKNNET